MGVKHFFREFMVLADTVLTHGSVTRYCGFSKIIPHIFVIIVRICPYMLFSTGAVDKMMWRNRVIFVLPSIKSHEIH